MRYILLLLAIGSALFAHAQKKGKAPTAYELEAQRFQELVTEGEQAEARGDAALAEERYAQALLLKRDKALVQKRGLLLLALQDTAGFCAQFGGLPRSDRGQHADDWPNWCLREDSVAYAESGLSGSAYSGTTNVQRTWARATGRTTHKLYDASDSLRIIISTNEHDTVFFMCEKNATFIGGETELYKFLGRSTRYPQYALDAGLMGTVYLTFVVGEHGELADVRVLRGVHHSLDNEALRVVGTMPRWEPARHRGQAVRFQYNLPIRFTLR